MLSIRKLAAERQRKQLATPDISFAIPDFATRPPVAAEDNFDSLSSRTCKPPSSPNFELQPLASHSDIRTTPYRRSPQAHGIDPGPPKLSLDLRLSLHISDQPRDAPVVSETPSTTITVAAEPSRPSYRFPRFAWAKDFSWLEDWGIK